MSLKLNDDEIIERLNQTQSLNDLFLSSVTLIQDQISQLTLTLVSKQHHAKEFVVPSLFGEKGPLNTAMVQVKLLYVLGLLSKMQFEDIEILLNHDEIQLNSNEDFIRLMTQLNCINLPPILTFSNETNRKQEIHTISNQLKEHILVQRQTQLIRSSYILGIANLFKN